MKRIKAANPYKPEVSLEQILAYEKDKPEPHTSSKLVNAVCDLFAEPKVLAGGQIAERLGLESKHLAFALEVLTGHTTSDIRAELIADRWRKEKKKCPCDTEDSLAQVLGFADGSALIHFMQRNKHRFPELYLKEQEEYNKMAPIVEKLMPEASNTVRRTFIRLPYQGSQEEKEACLHLLYQHGRHVADLALEIAKRLPDFADPLDTVESCALLHNVGIVKTDMPHLHCFGKKPYICHGEEGFNILGRMRTFRIEQFAAAQHLGAGITMKEIHQKRLPLASFTIDWPICKLICYASCFYSIFKPNYKESIDEIRANLAQYGEAAVQRFDELHRMFG